jgi:putative DNA primase/helicase
MNTLERARGRWREILPAIGVAPHFLTNKHGPCPICGGKDRFRFDDKDGAGTYICGQCGAGTGIILVRKLKGWDHRTACDEIDKIIGDAAPIAAQPARKSSGEHRKAACQRMLSEATDGNVRAAYLSRRGLSASSPVLRGHPRCPYFEEDGKRLGVFPAVIAPIIGPDGSLQSVQRVYDAPVPERKKTMPPVSTINGAAVRLFEPAEETGVCEGWETGLAAHELFGMPVWAALTEHGMQTFEWPPIVKTLHVFGDNDRSFVGQHAAYALARRAHKHGLQVVVHLPPDAGADWLDVLCVRRGVAA